MTKPLTKEERAQYYVECLGEERNIYWSPIVLRYEDFCAALEDEVERLKRERDRLQAKCRTEFEAVVSEVERLRKALALDDAWPITEVLRVLMAAATHLLDDHDCDHMGYESIVHANAAAAGILAALAKHDSPEG